MPLNIFLANDSRIPRALVSELLKTIAEDKVRPEEYSEQLEHAQVEAMLASTGDIGSYEPLDDYDTGTPLLYITDELDTTITSISDSTSKVMNNFPSSGEISKWCLGTPTTASLFNTPRHTLRDTECTSNGSSMVLVKIPQVDCFDTFQV